VPIVDEPKVSHVDRIALLRLSASYIRFRQLADKSEYKNKSSIRKKTHLKCCVIIKQIFLAFSFEPILQYDFARECGKHALVRNVRRVPSGRFYARLSDGHRLTGVDNLHIAQCVAMFGSYTGALE